MKHWILFFFLLPAVAATAQENASYKIYSVADNKEVSLTQMVSGLYNADVIFFGEEHNDSVGHMLELEIFKALHQQQKEKLSLSLEMFQTDVQLVLDEYLAGLVRETNLQKDGRLWNNYKDYRPLVEYAKENNIPVLAANAPYRYTNRVTKNGIGSLKELSREAKQLLAPLPIDTLTGRYYEKFAGLMGGHEGMGNMKIYQSQNVWDATMAWKIARILKKHKKSRVLHLNGRFHSDEKLGTYAQLQRYAPKLKLMNISCFSPENFNNPDWDQWAHLGDYIIITDPAVPKSF
ncbi:ChaN family lipoprotein [Niabella aquatica]